VKNVESRGEITTGNRMGKEKPEVIW